MRRPPRANAVRIRVAVRRLLVRVQRLILIHGGSANANGLYEPCAKAAMLTTGSCALCELTRSGSSGWSEWKQVPLEQAYRDTASRAALAVCPSFPSVVAQTSRSHELLLDTDALEDCAGSVPALRDAIRRSARVRGMDVF